MGDLKLFEMVFFIIDGWILRVIESCIIIIVYFIDSLWYLRNLFCKLDYCLNYI